MSKRAKSSEDSKEKIIELTIEQLEKQYGAGIIKRLGDRTLVEIPCVTTGSLALDIALGGKGLPKGRIVEIFGPESSGKTTLALHVVAGIQNSGGVAAFIDVEHALDPIYAKKLGVNTDDLLLSQPDWGEQALEICDLLVKSGAVDVIVIDSVAALVPKAEIEGEMGDSHVGLQARLMSQALRKLTASVYKANALVIFINQIREKIGVSWGSPETTSGGRALKFYSSVRLDIRRIGSVDAPGGDKLGNITRVKVVKSKICAPFKTAEFEIMYGHGISREGDIVSLGVETGIIKRSGAWLSHGETRLGQGRENAKQFLKENPQLAAEIEAQIRAVAVPVSAKSEEHAGAES
ncbi:MAG: recombinase RecA [Planctomycetes bacterium]|nr:recombinase RecA [Planctomycetota bacterium]